MKQEPSSTYLAENDAESATNQILQTLSIKDAHKELAWCDSYSRLPALLEISWRMDEADWLSMLGEFWPVCDNVGKHLDDLMDSPFGYREGPIAEMMTEEDQAMYASLPEVVTVYRGCYKDNKWGVSWTTSLEVAEGFPSLYRYRQYGHQPILVKATIKKSNIKAVKTDRNESEIIAWRPKHVSTRHIKVDWAPLG